MRALLLALISVVLLAAFAPAASAKPVLGIADQKASMFSDPRFAGLGIRAVRLSIRWDALRDPISRAGLDMWMLGARTRGARPLLTFDRSPKRPSYNPSPRELAREMRAMRRRYPGLKEFATWNEANINKKPKIVARWYRALKQACPSCKILATDLVDHPNAVSWAKRFIKENKGKRPAYWGLHNYVAMNRRSAKSTLELVREIKGRWWLTETGGVVKRKNLSRVRFPTGVTHAGRVTQYMLSTLPKKAKRIERIYVYHWDTGFGADPKTWDSALVDASGHARPALKVIARYQGRELLPDPPPLVAIDPNTPPS